MISHQLLDLQDDLSKRQIQLINQIKNTNDKELIKELDKQLDAISTFTNALIKFRRHFSS
jgi:hypothetical protein